MVSVSVSCFSFMFTIFLLSYFINYVDKNLTINNAPIIGGGAGGRVAQVFMNDSHNLNVCHHGNESLFKNLWDLPKTMCELIVSAKNAGRYYDIRGLHVMPTSIVELNCNYTVGIDPDRILFFPELPDLYKNIQYKVYNIIIFSLLVLIFSFILFGIKNKYGKGNYYYYCIIVILMVAAANLIIGCYFIYLCTNFVSIIQNYNSQPVDLQKEDHNLIIISYILLSLQFIVVLNITNIRHFLKWISNLCKKNPTTDYDDLGTCT